MSYPATSNFVAASYGSAWWAAEEAARSRVVILESAGRAVIAQIQNVLYAGVRPGTRGFNTTLARRIKVDGIVGPETLNALWAYGRIVGLSSAQLAPIEADIRARRFGDVTAVIAIWLTYHQPRRIDLDAGPVGARTRVQRTDPAIAFDVAASAIRLPAGTILPAYLEAPGVPEADTALLQIRPTIIPLDAAGNPLREQAQVIGGEQPADARTQTPATSETTFTPAPVAPTPAPAPTPTPTVPVPAPAAQGPSAAGTPGAVRSTTTTNTSSSKTGIRPLQLVFGALALAGLYAVATDR